ncbi:protein kinase family protein [Oceanobacillus salinisoli]|uniref:hypothetical protein n=1 Tax=Oceanobacillus salinisoli TaxID=2678611 RepID=UPI0012E2A1DD|nr:hypothetical protein [Oceanobacillus salinisoli]
MTEYLKFVLQAYNIYTNKIHEVTPRLFKVNDHQQAYALKRSALTDKDIRNWEGVYRLANAKNLDTVLPVYLTKDGQFFFRHNNSIYYVSPWVEETNHKRNKTWISNFYETLADVHNKTKRTQKLPMEKVSTPFTSFQSFCNNAKNHLLTFVQQFEKKRYMSPFELLVCTQFRDIEYACTEADKRIHRFLNDHEGDEIKWNYSLCHRNLNATHIKKSYFVNWEHARYDNPVMDLVIFFHQEIGHFNPASDLFIDLFPSYTKINELTLPELQLLSIYLLSPGEYMQTIHHYMNNMRTESMVQYVTKLQYQYRKILFGLKWSEYLEREFESHDLDNIET